MLALNAAIEAARGPSNGNSGKGGRGIS
nr:hypothetical protein [Candidatus Vondammii sp. HM_W22]